jgi:hypothetical protein
MTNPGDRPLRQRWWWPAVGYTGGLLLAGAAQAVVSPAAQAAWFDWASTDLDNLARNPIGSMIASAFVMPEDPVAWLGLSLVGLATLGRRFGPVRTGLLLVAAHVVGTLVSQGALAWRLAHGLAPVADRYAPDVGPSYVVVAGLTAGVLVGRSWWRPGCAIGFGLLAPYLFDGLARWEVAAVGHLAAITVSAVAAAGLVLIDRTRTERARQARDGVGPAGVDKAEVTRQASPDG